MSISTCCATHVHYRHYSRLNYFYHIFNENAMCSFQSSFSSSHFLDETTDTNIRNWQKESTFVRRTQLFLSQMNFKHLKMTLLLSSPNTKAHSNHTFSVRRVYEQLISTGDTGALSSFLWSMSMSICTAIT